MRAEPSVEVDESKLAAAKREAAARSARVSTSYQRPPSNSARAPETRSGPRPEPASDDEERPLKPPIMVAGRTMNLDTSSIPGLDDAKTFTDKVKVARKLYGRRRYEQAYELALELLEEEPRNRRVLRVAVASSCIMANIDNAEMHYARLEYTKDKRQMKRRCKAYGVQLSD